MLTYRIVCYGSVSVYELPVSLCKTSCHFMWTNCRRQRYKKKTWVINRSLKLVQGLIKSWHYSTDFSNETKVELLFLVPTWQTWPCIREISTAIYSVTDWFSARENKTDVGCMEGQLADEGYNEGRGLVPRSTQSEELNGTRRGRENLRSKRTG